MVHCIVLVTFVFDFSINITVKVNFTSLLRKVLVGERKSFYGFYLEKENFCLTYGNPQRS